ncbi:hypothetical protein F3J20_30230 [Paraburkholderia sp. Cy-641]|uniref:hypothetical protein n=1 Tax=Paraburkholderia sp. Cy-641 TaxID=2608337 RepID=UPI0014238963|nr:hypothetical protein [Paraburkholderia sp. Cy-641]NIF81599.1 hypothetical protein [Paraburkholderia sp. Cy-641]
MSLIGPNAALVQADVAAAFEISAVSYKGLSVTTAAGQPARLAVVDSNGKVIDASEEVAKAAWDVAVQSYRNFLMGTGHLRVLSRPPTSKAST